MKSPLFSRRNLLQKSGCGLGLLGLAGLLGDEGLLGKACAEDSLGNRSLNPLAPQPGHFTAKAKRVIWIFINGGPSPVDTWNYRPELTKWDGKSIKEFKKASNENEEDESSDKKDSSRKPETK